jgi:hypothetical protein
MNDKLLRNVNKKDESMEENITNMIENLLKDDDGESKSYGENAEVNVQPDIKILKTQVDSFQNAKTPMLCINDIPFAQSPNFDPRASFSKVNRTRLSVFMNNGSSENMPEVTERKRHSINLTNSRELENINHNMNNNINNNMNENMMNMSPGLHYRIPIPNKMQSGSTLILSSNRTENYTSASSCTRYYDIINLFLVFIILIPTTMSCMLGIIDREEKRILVKIFISKYYII